MTYYDDEDEQYYDDDDSDDDGSPYVCGFPPRVRDWEDVNYGKQLIVTVGRSCRDVFIQFISEHKFSCWDRQQSTRKWRASFSTTQSWSMLTCLNTDSEYFLVCLKHWMSTRLVIYIDLIRPSQGLCHWWCHIGTHWKVVVIQPQSYWMTVKSGSLNEPIPWSRVQDCCCKLVSSFIVYTISSLLKTSWRVWNRNAVSKQSTFKESLRNLQNKLLQWANSSCEDAFELVRIYNDAVEESEDEDAKDGNETPQQAARGRRKSKRKKTPVSCVAKAGMIPSVGESIDKPTEEFKTRCDEFLGCLCR